MFDELTSFNKISVSKYLIQRNALESGIESRFAFRINIDQCIHPADINLLFQLSAYATNAHPSDSIVDGNLILLIIVFPFTGSITYKTCNNRETT